MLPSPSPGILMQSTHEIENATTKLTSALSKAFLQSCPVSRAPKKPSYPWFTEELRTLRQETRRLFNNAKSTKLECDWDLYRTSFNEYKSSTRKAKRESWAKFCAEMESTTEAARLRKCFSKEASTPGFLKTANGVSTENSLDTLNLLMDTHFPGCRSGELSEDDFISDVISPENREAPDTLDVIISDDKMVFSRQCCKTRQTRLHHGYIESFGTASIWGIYQRVGERSEWYSSPRWEELITTPPKITDRSVYHRFY